jgi:hypothetical protein
MVSDSSTGRPTTVLRGQTGFPLPAGLLLRDRLPPWAAVGPRTLALSAKGPPNADDPRPRDSGVAGTTPTARSCRPARSLSQWANLRAPAALQTGDPARNRRVPVGQAVERGHHPSAPRRRPGSSRDAAAASAANSKHETSTWAPTSRTRIRWGETPTAPVRDVWLPAAPSRSTNSPVRRERTQTRHARDAGRSPRTPDTRRRTRGSGDRTRTPGYRTPDARTPDRRMWARTGRRTLDGWTLDKRTLTEDADGASKAQWASDILAPRRRWDVEPCCCGRHTRALGNHDGSAVRPPANARDCLLHRKPAAGSLRRQPSGASAHCSRVLDLDGTRGGQWDYGR